MLKTRQEKILLLIVIGVSILVLSFKLGDRCLENNDRLLYAEISREMVQSGDWIVLRHNGEVYINKPPLYFWLVAVPAQIYGAVTPFIARLPSLVCAILGIVTIFFFGKKIYRSAMAGFLSSMVLLSCYEFSSHARTAQTDMLLCLFIVLSLFLFYTSYNATEGGKRLLYFLLFCATVGLGVMVKGTTGFIIPVLTAIAFLAYKRDLKLFCKRQYLLGIIVFVAIVLPWPIIVCKKIGGLTATLAVLQEGRFFTRSEAFYFYLVEVPKRFFPWSVFLPATFYYLFSRTRKLNGSDKQVRLWQARDDSFFPMIWFGTMLVILSVPECKNSRYMLPVYPALALTVGGMWDWVLNTRGTASERWLKVSIIVSLVILSIVQVAAPVFFSYKYQYLFPLTMCTGIFFLGAIILFCRFKRAEMYSWSIVVITAFYILAQIIHVQALSVEDARHSPGRDLAGSVSTYVKEQELLAYNLPVRYLEPLNFYMNRVLPLLKDREGIHAALASDNPRYVIMQESDYQSLDSDLKAMVKFDKEALYKDKRLVVISNRR